jgi:N-acetylmuramoyl-L-alanine amidase
LTQRTLSSRIGGAALVFAAVWAAVLASGCRKAPAPLPQRGANSGAPSALPVRAEAVAQADALAVEAGKRAGAAAAGPLSRAAELRERLFRLEHKEADALEAVELWGATARASAPAGCSAGLREALLEGELRSDPAAAYRRIHAERARANDTECRKIAERALLALAAFRPLPSVLAEIEREARGAASAPPANAAAASAAAERALGPVVMPSVGVPAAGPVKITAVERYGAKDAARVVVHVTHPARFDVKSLEPSGSAPARLVVDLQGVSYEGAKSLAVGGLVERVRLGAQKNATRVVLDLAETAYRRVFYLPEPFRLVIDLSKGPPVGVTQASSGKRVVRRVVLDPGHGGHDPGAVGPQGLREKDVTLDIAHRAAPLLARELGISTLLTRDTDVFVALDERTARANAFGADLLISIHCNSSEDGGGKGVMSFVLDDSRDALAARIAARENSASAAAAAELANAMSRVMDRATLGHSEELAGLLQRAAMSSLRARYSDVPDLGVRRAGFYVLAGAMMPAVLFETSFVSNALGEERLNSADYRSKLADSIVNAVRAYREGKSAAPVPSGLGTGTPPH